MVNAEVKEKVFNKEVTPRYLGCYSDIKRSSCNTIINHIPLKYSEVKKENRIYINLKKKSVFEYSRVFVVLVIWQLI